MNTQEQQLITSLQNQITNLQKIVSQLVTANNKRVQTLTALTSRIVILETANQAHAATLTAATQQTQAVAATTPTTGS